jgi:hypothetical protein
MKIAAAIQRPGSFRGVVMFAMAGGRPTYASGSTTFRSGMARLKPYDDARRRRRRSRLCGHSLGQYKHVFRC